MFKFLKKNSKLQKDVESNSFNNAHEKFEKGLDELKIEYNKNKDLLNIQLNWNLEGKELEMKGDIEGAIKLYEENLKEDFVGNHPYDRLAIIYRNKKMYSEEKRVLEKAIKVFSTKVSDERSDKNPKLERFKERLKTVNDKYLIG